MTDSAWQNAARQSGWLTASAALLWLLSAGPAYGLSGVAGLEGLSIAAGLSLLPGWLVFWSVAAVAKVPGNNSQGMIVLAATGLRLLFVLIGVLAMKLIRPDLGLREFHGWVVAFYCVSLLVETLMLVRSLSQADSAGASESMAANSDLVSAN